jgi:predicted N-acetyltransferase YhbS
MRGRYRETRPRYDGAMNGLTLRPARVDDIPTLQAVERDADARFGVEGDVIPDEDARRAVDAGKITVAEVDGAVVGWVYLGAIAGEPCIGQISVTIAHGRKGIGTALLTHALAQARARGASSVVLNTERDRPWNAPWYARHGFAVVPEAAWSPALRAVTEAQRAAGLDWSTRVHMRKAL